MTSAEFGFTPLIAAVYNNDVESATVLLQLKENDDRGDAEGLRRLLERKRLADPNGGRSELKNTFTGCRHESPTLLIRSSQSEGDGR